MTGVPQPDTVPLPDNVVQLAAVLRRPGEAIEVGELPQQVNLTIYQGATFEVRITVSQDSEPADLEGMEVDAQIRQRPASEEVMAQWDASIDGSVINLGLSADQTAVLSARGGAWDVRLRTPDYTTYVVRGRVRVAERVTR